MKTNCGNCNKELNKKPSYLLRYTKVYCSKECRKASLIVDSVECSCGECGKSFELKPHDLRKAKKASKSGYVFCSKTCSAICTNRLKGIEGVSTYRKRAFKEKENKCANCGYDKHVEVLQVHHIDRDRMNGKISNLKILCPTCHNEEHFINNDGVFWNN